jgi:hypothetical protein
MSNVKELSSRVNTLSKHSTENLLEIGLVFLDAKRLLNESEHNEFLKETQYLENTSTVRKWERIGQAHLRLKSVSHLLPPVFTTIYKLSQLETSELNVLIENKILRPSVTTKEIDAELNPHIRTTSKPIFNIFFNEYATDEIVKEVHDLLMSYSSYCEVETNDIAQEMIDNATNPSCVHLKVA